MSIVLIHVGDMVYFYVFDIMWGTFIRTNDYSFHYAFGVSTEMEPTLGEYCFSSPTLFILFFFSTFLAPSWIFWLPQQDFFNGEPFVGLEYLKGVSLVLLILYDVNGYLYFISIDC